MFFFCTFLHVVYIYIYVQYALLLILISIHIDINAIYLGNIFIYRYFNIKVFYVKLYIWCEHKAF